ncbi:MAG: DUF3253 domain-containing protein [Azospirillaceae bacterium]
MTARREKAEAAAPPRPVGDGGAADSARIGAVLLDLADRRGPERSFCPSEAARAVAPPNGAGDPAWRALMPQVRAVAARLVAEGRLAAARRGRPFDPVDPGGPFRLSRSPGRGRD